MPVMGAFHCFMGVDEKVGGADEREDAEEAFICLMLWRLVRQRETGDRQRRWCRRGKKAAKGEARGEEGRVVNKHIFMYGFRLQSTLPPPGLINSEERSQSFFFSPHTSTHGLAMTFTSFEAKSGSRYSTLQ